MRDNISSGDLDVEHELTIAGICLLAVIRWNNAPDNWDVHSIEICDEGHFPYSDQLTAGHPLFSAFREIIIRDTDATLEILESMPEPLMIAALEEDRAERAALMSARI